MRYEFVIVGGGAGGLELAAMLGRRLGRRHGRERVLLVDKFPFHIWKPSLHEVAAGTLDAHQEGLSYTVLAWRNHFSFTQGELDALDVDGKTIALAPMVDEHGVQLVPARRIGWDKLVLAVGSGSNDFGTPGIEHAYLLENVRDAQRFHADWIKACMRAPYTEGRRLSVAIVGAGATGVELSAELTESHAAMLEGLGAGQQFDLAISLVEAGPRILGGLPPRISELAQVALIDRRVQVLTNTQVKALAPGVLTTSGGDIQADLIVWAAGIKAAEANTRLGLPVNRINQFIVDEHLRTSAPGVYAMGDCAACPWVDGKTVPARAQAAHQQASYLAPLLLSAPGKGCSSRIERMWGSADRDGMRGANRRHGRSHGEDEQRSRPPESALPHAAPIREEHPKAAKPFVYKDLGSLVSLGDNTGVGNLMGSLSGRKFFVHGLIAKWMYMSLHLMHHRTILGTARTASLALARLLQRRVSGRKKLH